MGLRTVVATGLCLVCLNARAASVTQIGADGTAGAPGLNSPPAASATDGGVGTNGASVNADVGLSPDASNVAIGTGGKGGAGGPGGTSASGPVGAGGNGGSGGGAFASAMTTAHGSGALAQTTATGGAGGDAGLAGGLNGAVADGGFGGNANAGSGVTNDGGTAHAIATATGGDAGRSRIATGGAASADAQATGLGDTTAEAHAVGGSSFASIPFGISGTSATAHASATSTDGNASATAEARGGGWEGPGVTLAGPTAASGTPTAQAFAPHGDATAIARGNIGEIGIQVLANAVSGGASGKLTLIQEAIGDKSQTGGANSTLSAVNQYGGALFAESIATGDAARGSATASVDAQSQSDAPVEVHAIATGSVTRADASILANPDASLLSTSKATTSPSSTLRQPLHSASSVFLRNEMGSKAALDFNGVGFPLPPPNTFDTSAQANRAAPQVDLSTVEARSARADTYLHASPSDVADWLAGNPNAQAAVDKHGEVLGLASAALRGDSTDPFSYSGSLSFTVNVTEPDNRGLTFALLDPTAVGNIDVLNIQLRSNSQVLFEESFSGTADALAGLDDHVIPREVFAALGNFVNVELAFSVSFLPGEATPGLAFDAAFLRVVPEPAPAALLGLAGLALATLRQRAQRAGR